MSFFCFVFWMASWMCPLLSTGLCALKTVVSNEVTGVSSRCMVSSCWPVDTWMFLLYPAPGITALLHMGHSLTLDWRSAFPFGSLWMTWSLFPLVSVSLLCVCVCVSDILALWLRRAEWKRSLLGFSSTPASMSCSYQARGEDSLGLLGFSGVCVSLRALCNINHMGFTLIFTFKAHLFFPQTAALYSLVALWLQADRSVWGVRHISKIWAANLLNQSHLA